MANTDPRDQTDRFAVLQDLGWRLEHHMAARALSPDAIAQAIDLDPEDFALALTGHHELPFSTICAVLNQLDLAWEELYGVDLLRLRRVHHLTLEQSAWHAMDAGIQLFDVRRDVERYRAGDWLCLWERLPTNMAGRILWMEVTYVLYLASVALVPGYVVMALRPLDAVEVSKEAPPLTVAQQDELRARCARLVEELSGGERL